jgi:putative NIF3 family GTP cyclohydrolase 1 type 2
MSTQAAVTLESLGFQNVNKLDVGFDEWKVEGYPVEMEEKQLIIDPSISYRSITIPMISNMKKLGKVSASEFISSDSIVEFLENNAFIFDFDYVGYEIKTVNEISNIYLMINPDPRNFKFVPSGSLVICHHKISVYKNRIYEAILAQAKEKNFNIYNFHLGWDIMVDGIGDSFLFHLGLLKEEIQKVDLTYKDRQVPRLGSIIRSDFSLEEIVGRLDSLYVNPSVIVNPKCQNSKVGYIPGGGFVDSMIIEMSDLGTDILISSDPNWVVEILARELGMTLIAIDHYTSERYGLQAMQTLLTTAFPKNPTIILENVDSIQCPPEDCPCCDEEHLKKVPIR